ncbi:hypothetical protein J3L18_10805 [Mucilaginibacter gossypii]|uniref:hypothetical protein n=1 Tax=Mucilaginibacter gossypii TaxID=551996 RepID=UPI000DCD71CA|nr:MULTISPECIES: hypothetical protein [Mucilaginibacter]QTE39516.1 hypothetical protein J3L18_10805 [Mucilaginibacter gossypii]RAV56122.1 hypothetical protein DIU36_15315 [Mucilaginibacter rubeus]
MSNKISTVDDFEKLSDKEKMDFKMNHAKDYQALFNNATVVKPAEDTSSKLSLTPYKSSDIKTADDFEKLSLAQQLDFKAKNNDAYLALFGMTNNVGAVTASRSSFI